MDEATHKALKKIIDYLYLSEYKHYKELDAYQRRNHIFVAVQQVSQYLDELEHLN